MNQGLLKRVGASLEYLEILEKENGKGGERQIYEEEWREREIWRGFPQR